MRLLRCQLPVSEKGRRRWDGNIPNDDAQLLGLGIIRDCIGVNWKTRFGVGSKRLGKRRTRVGDERLMDCVRYQGSNNLSEIRTRRRAKVCRDIR